MIGEVVKTRTVIYGIGADAKKLKVSRYHLGEVLKGRRFAPWLARRYYGMKGLPVPAHLLERAEELAAG